jgi:ABC-type bacteriocin/lantibiotic exporter with double-glycine peptidase domain
LRTRSGRRLARVVKQGLEPLGVREQRDVLADRPLLTLEHGRALVFEDALNVHLLTHHVVQPLDLTLSRLQHGIEAARLAGCHEMILRLPQGYDTEIGDGGQHLSGGQRQLIGLARALYGAPKLVVLDEPNSNLDGDAEQALIRGIEELKRQGVTVVLVSHRPTLVQGVDQVLLMRDGAVEAFGPRAEVLKRLVQQARPAEVPSSRVEGAGR